MDIAIARQLAAGLIKRLEACSLTAYKDSTGVWTIGYGSTGPAVVEGLAISQDVADHLLLQDMAVAHERLDTALFGSTTALGEHEFAALWSFVFNVGAEPQWTIWKDIKAGNLADVPTQLLRFDHGKVGGRLVELPGLKNRRLAEIVFWRTGDANAAVAALGVHPAALPSATTRAIVTPPVPTAPKPLSVSALVNHGVTVAAGSAAALGGVAGQIHDVAAAHASESHYFNALAVGAAGVVVACSIIGILIHAEQAHARTV